MPVPSKDIPLKPLKIFLIEDSDDDVYLLKRHIEKAGFELTIVRILDDY
ncbi:MAG: hypothetical protein K8R21_04655 [Leptospira sp.]|nr:hypothetical protein [Leptospira sp.]